MYDHWTTEHYARLPLLNDLSEAAEMGIEILAGLRYHHTYVTQICGPMTTGGLGSLEKNMARFVVARDEARERGIVIFDQIPFQEVIIRLTDHHRSTEYNMDILEVFYQKLFLAGHITHAWFLPDWQSSRGACWEHEFLSAQPGVFVEEYPVGWLKLKAA